MRLKESELVEDVGMCEGFEELKLKTGGGE